MLGNNRGHLNYTNWSSVVEDDKVSSTVGHTLTTLIRVANINAADNKTDEKKTQRRLQTLNHRDRGHTTMVTRQMLAFC